MKKLIIVGSGAAGYTAAIYAARANLTPLVLDGVQPGGQLTLTTEIENFPGFPTGITGPELMDGMRRQAERFGARFVMDSVASAEFGGRPLHLTLAGGQMLAADAVIIATGATPKYLGLPSEQQLIGHGVSACATCDGAFYRNEPIAVVGGGDTAMEEALFLTRFASRITVIHRRDQFRASPIMAGRVLQHSKIEVRWNSVVEEVLDVARQEVTGLRLKHVQTGARSTLAVKGLFVAIGYQPNTAPFRGQLDTDAAGYVRTTGVRTSRPGVFAAGDVQDPTYRQAITAAGSGCMAALEAQRYLEELAHGRA